MQVSVAEEFSISSAVNSSNFLECRSEIKGSMGTGGNQRKMGQKSKLVKLINTDGPTDRLENPR